MDKTQDLIQATIGKLAALNAAKKHFDVLTQQIQDDRQKLQSVSQRLEIEAQEIEELQKMSITSIFHKVLGNKDSKIEKERKEYLALALQFKELTQNIEINEFEVGVLRKKKDELASTLSTLEELKVRREAEIMQSDEAIKSSLLGIYSEMDDINKIREEIVQAVAAGRNALGHIEIIRHNLKEAIKWGEWDQMSHNRNYDRMKHTALDTAVNAAFKAQQALNIFNDELSDVGFSAQDFGLNITAFKSFVDMFFDNLISDWIIQNKIKNAANSVDMVMDKVQSTLQTLDSEIEEAHAKAEECLRLKDEILMRG